MGFRGTVGLTVALLGLLLTGDCAWGGPPFVTDDPETPSWHGWEINIPFTMERSPDETSLQLPLFDINYGFRPNVQFKIEFPFECVKPAGSPHTCGFGDTLIGVKWRFLEEGEGRCQLAIYPQVSLPTGDSDRGLGEGKASCRLPAIAEKSWEKWKAYGNLGLVLQTKEEKRDYFFWGVTIVREVGEGLELGGELFGNSASEVGGHSGLAFNIGGEWKMRKWLVLLFSAGRSLRRGPSLSVYLGLQILTRGSQ